MTFDCKDLERALAIPELLPDAREHAKVCDACRRELWLWNEMSTVRPSDGVQPAQPRGSPHPSAVLWRPLSAWR